MSNVVAYTHTQGAEKAYKKVEKKLTPEFISEFKVRADLSFDPRNNSIKATGKGFELQLEFFEEEVKVNLETSLIYRPIKSSVLTKIKSMLSSLL